MYTKPTPFLAASLLVIGLIIAAVMLIYLYSNFTVAETYIKISKAEVIEVTYSEYTSPREPGKKYLRMEFDYSNNEYRNTGYDWEISSMPYKENSNYSIDFIEFSYFSNNKYHIKRINMVDGTPKLQVLNKNDTTYTDIRDPRIFQLVVQGEIFLNCNAIFPDSNKVIIKNMCRSGLDAFQKN